MQDHHLAYQLHHPVAVSRFNLRTGTAEAFGVFPSLAEVSEALEAECRSEGYPPPGPVAVDRNGYGVVRVAEVDGGVVDEYHLIANDGSRHGEAGGVAGFSVVCNGDGSVSNVYPCGIYASEAEIRDLDAFERQVIKGIEDHPRRWLIIPFSAGVGDR
jgi:hypothetical protein